MLDAMRVFVLLLAMTALAQSQPAQQPPPTLESRMLAVCQEQRNAALTWHAGAQAQLSMAQEEITALRAELAKLKAAQ